MTNNITNASNGHNRHKLILNIYAFCTVLIWATAFPITRMIGDSLSFNTLGALRCTTASILLLIIGKFCHIRKPASVKHGLLLAISGVMGFTLYMIFFNIGMHTLSSATSSIVIAITPVLTAICSSKLFGEKINIIGWLSIITAFAGVVILLLWNGVLSINVGIPWTFGAAAVFCIYNLLNRKLSSLGYTSIEIVTWSMISGAIILILISPSAVSQISSASISTILLAIYLGICPSAISYFLWSNALQLADKTNEVTNYMFITPILSTIMGFFLLGEMPDTGTYIGGFMIIAALIIFNLKGR